LTSSRDIVRIVDQLRNSRVLNTCPSVPIDIPNANGANVGVDMSCVTADPHRVWFNPPVRISNNSTGAVIRRPSSFEIYKRAGEFLEGTIFFKE
jgi:hypothetical protein